MDLERAQELLTVLAEGINPLTGEILPDDDSCNQVEIVRALNLVLKTIESTPKKTKQVPENHGKPWTKEDEDKLCQLFDSGYSKKELCNSFLRSSLSIAIKLEKLGKINNRYELK